MKETIFFAIAATIVACVLIVSVIVSRKNDPFEHNVEALSLIEEGASGHGTCYSRIHTTDTGLVLFCGTCIYVRGERNLIFPGPSVCN